MYCICIIIMFNLIPSLLCQKYITSLNCLQRANQLVVPAISFYGLIIIYLLFIYFFGCGCRNLHEIHIRFFPYSFLLRWNLNWLSHSLLYPDKMMELIKTVTTNPIISANTVTTIRVVTNLFKNSSWHSWLFKYHNEVSIPILWLFYDLIEGPNKNFWEDQYLI